MNYNKTTQLYIDLLKGCLLDIYRPNISDYSPINNKVLDFIHKGIKVITKKRYRLCKEIPINFGAKMSGQEWSPYGMTMIGINRLNNIQGSIETVISNNIEGDLVECGVWRGGACIFMRAMLDVYGDSSKKVWVCDSFDGLPPHKDCKYKVDRDILTKRVIKVWVKYLKVPLRNVKANFMMYGMLDDRVKFVEGFFKDTLPTAPVDKISILRLDADLYESTMDILNNLYDKVSVGGYIIVDDWGAVKGCKQAIEDFREERGIVAPIKWTDWSEIYWVKE